jgi:CheY-like chemotaxis protein
MPTLLTVLVAEDDDLIRNIFVEIIKGEGLNPLEAVNGQRALELLADHHVDIIISDMKMPVMDGFTLLLAVKKAHPEIPVIVITGFNSEYQEADALAAGADAYITKPFRVVDVAATLKQVRRRMDASPMTTAKP